MDLRLFLSTFALVFLAELGDKTQLASMAASAGSKSPLSVFLGAAAALVVSTLVAVLVGSALHRVVPQQYLKIGASLLFLGFGAVLLVSACMPRAPAKAAPVRQSLLMRAVLDTAAAFEKASAADYLSMAQQTGDQALRAVFLHLAAEEEEHVRSLHALASSHADIAWGEHDKEIETIAGPKTPLSAARILDDAVAHEKATAGFYRELSRSAPLPAVRAAFARLADEEESHLAHLTDYRAGGSAAGASTG